MKPAAGWAPITKPIYEFFKLRLGAVSYEPLAKGGKNGLIIEQAAFKKKFIIIKDIKGKSNSFPNI